MTRIERTQYGWLAAMAGGRRQKRRSVVGLFLLLCLGCGFVSAVMIAVDCLFGM